jgi:hypothetical protein
MRAQFIAPGLVVAGFAVTLSLTAWQEHQRPTEPPITPVPAVKPLQPPPAPPVVESAVIPAPERQAGPVAGDAQAAQPPLPDPQVSPSDQEDHADRERETSRSSRVR